MFYCIKKSFATCYLMNYKRVYIWKAVHGAVPKLIMETCINVSVSRCNVEFSWYRTGYNVHTSISVTVGIVFIYKIYEAENGVLSVCLCVWRTLVFVY